MNRFSIGPSYYFSSSIDCWTANLSTPDGKPALGLTFSRANGLTHAGSLPSAVKLKLLPTEFFFINGILFAFFFFAVLLDALHMH